MTDDDLSDESRQSALTDVFSPDNPEPPYKDEQLMRELYLDKKMSMNAISKEFDCSPTTVRVWLDKHGIETRSPGESVSLALGVQHGGVCFKTSRHGYMVWQDSTGSSSVHRLLAVAEWGFEAMRDKHVHHINGIPWDNRVENLKIVSNSDHQSEHLKVDGVERIRVAELYEHGDISIRDLGEMFDVSGTTVFNIHKEFYGDD